MIELEKLLMKVRGY